MPGFKGQIREPEADPRARRNSQNLATSVEFINPGSIVQLDGDGTFTLNLGTGVQDDGGTLKTNDSQIVHDNLSGFVANEHVDHSGVTVTGGTGISGGGDLTANRTLNLDAATAGTIGGVLLATAVADLNQTISSPPTQTEVQDLSDKVDELLGVLRNAGVLDT